MSPAETLAWASAIEASALSVTLKQSALLYPLVNVGHVIGIAVIAGAIAALDLRLLGFARSIPVEAAERFLRGIVLAGLIIAVPTGVLLFVPDAITLSQSATFLVKLLLVALGLANAALFILLWRGRMGKWNTNPPLAGRVQAVASLMIWFGAVSAGRLIAYW